jgi:GrpB-like predicted nucleotidyltransferase (UPF0157 family)
MNACPMTDDSHHLDATLDEVLIGGREPMRVDVVDYDPRWPARFAAERDRIAAALGHGAVRVEHIGSTAVHGLAAKPIVDILVVVADAQHEAAYLPALEAAGYPLRVRESGHRMFRTTDRDVHVHVYGEGAPEIADYLALRDRLRADPGDRRLYERTKRRLAERDWPDMNYYAKAKTDVIAEVLGRARDSTSG